jgi:8-oxo-dGTP pyrophosphatase MutT (NUDIX family)
MEPVYALEAAPGALRSSIFLAGPTPRDEATPSWRPEALRLLAARGYDGVVFLPEPRDGRWQRDYDAQVDWEERHLEMADVILFWLPRELTSMPGLTTNDEWGTYKRSGKVVFGAPPGAEKVRYQRHYAEKFHAGSAGSLEATVALALERIGEGALREGGEREVPLLVWRTEAFQRWYAAQKAAGNRLDGAKLEWICRAGPRRSWLFLWALRPSVHIAAEGRNKRGEVVLGRPDISAVLLHRRAADPWETEVVLVREFRSAVRNPGAMVLELPSGSSFQGGEDPLRLAVDETREETGLALDGARLTPVASRQLASTLLSHHAQLYEAALTAEEVAWLRARAGEAQGDPASSERTYVEVQTLRQLLTCPELDWSTLGMILSILGPGR